MFKDSTSFGDTLAVSVTVAANLSGNNAVVYSNDIPTSMNLGQTYNVTVTIKNTGTTTWTKTDGYKYSAIDSTDSFVVTSKIELAGTDSIAPNGTKAFQFTLKPTSEGTQATKWRMMREGSEWFGETLIVNIVVGNAPCTTNCTNGTLTGTVTDGDGNPVNEVELYYTEASGTKKDVTKTDDDGKYNASLPVGNYTIYAAKNDYTTESATIVIVKNQTTTKDFILNKEVGGIHITTTGWVILGILALGLLYLIYTRFVKKTPRTIRRPRPKIAQLKYKW
jgi:hypothetical protein